MAVASSPAQEQTLWQLEHVHVTRESGQERISALILARNDTATGRRDTMTVSFPMSMGAIGDKPSGEPSWNAPAPKPPPPPVSEEIQAQVVERVRRLADIFHIQAHVAARLYWPMRAGALLLAILFCSLAVALGPSVYSPNVITMTNGLGLFCWIAGVAMGGLLLADGLETLAVKWSGDPEYHVSHRNNLVHMMQHGVGSWWPTDFWLSPWYCMLLGRTTTGRLMEADGAALQQLVAREAAIVHPTTRTMDQLLAAVLEAVARKTLHTMRAHAVSAVAHVPVSVPALETFGLSPS